MTEPSRRPVTPEDLLSLKAINDVQLSPDGSRVAYTLSEIDADADEYRMSIWLVEADGGTPTRLTQGRKKDMYPRWSPDGKRLAFLSDRDGDKPQLYVLPLDGGEARKLTSLDYGVGPAAWSPDGTRLLFTARPPFDPAPQDKDARKRWEQRPKVVTRAHYKDDGSGYTFDAATQIYVISTDGGEPTQITHGHREHLTPAWSPDGTKIAYAQTREGAGDFRVSDIWVADASGKQPRCLERNIGRAVSPTWSPDGTTIACYGSHEQIEGLGDPDWLVWTMSAEGGGARKLTAEHDRSVAQFPPPTVTAGPTWSPDGQTLTYPLADRGNVHIGRVNVATGEVSIIVGGIRQVTAASYAPEANRLAFAAAGMEYPSDVFVADWNDGSEQRLTEINADLLSQLQLPRVERRDFATPYGHTVEGWVTYPTTGSGPAPLLVDIHGGPHAFHMPSFFIVTFYRYVLASRGWAILTVNPTGSGSYGRDFALNIRGQWGEYDLPEQNAAIDDLVAEGVADPERLAVTGYSYGGYMTSWIVGHSDRFKAAVIGAPVTNLESFHGTSDIGMWFGAWEMLGTITDAREAFRRLSPVNYVDRVTTPCLILHGEADDRCPIGQGEEFFVGLVAQGKVPTEFVRYPGGSHMFLRNGRPSHRVDYSARVVDWVERYANAPQSETVETQAADGD
ncbi:MAG: S9 family peptidase [Anaerolineae bacterium]